MLLELIKGLALLLSLALLHSFVIRHFSRNISHADAVSGLLFGIICIVGMSIPIEPVSGVIFDGRSVILSMVGVYAGWLGALIASTIAAAYRIWLGGAGAPVGVAVIIMCGMMGIAFKQYLSHRVTRPNLLHLLLFGALVHLFEIGLFTQLPAEAVEKVLSTVAVPLFVTFTPAVAILGLLLRDNVDRLETERALRTSMQELRNKQFIIDEHAIFSQTDKRGIITFVNDKFCQVSGYAAADLIGQNHRVLNSGTHSADFFKNMWLTISDGGVWAGDINNRRKDGSYYWVKSTIAPQFDSEGQIEGYVSIRTDITDEIIRQEELIKTRNIATEANAAKANFIAAMSHELRTPLNAIIGFSQMMKDRVFGEIQSEKYSEYINDINESGVSLLTMVDEVLDISRLESQDYRFELQEYDVGEFTKEFVKRFEYAVEEKNISLKVNVGSAVPQSLYSDKRALTHLLNNLISNSIKAVDSGGEISVIWNVNDSNDLTLSVIDDGCGMPQELIDKIGLPFMHNDDAYIAKDPNIGAGLGLYICQNLLKARGASMDVQSVIDEGTTVTVSAPLSLFQKPTTG